MRAPRKPEKREGAVAEMQSESIKMLSIGIPSKGGFC